MSSAKNSALKFLSFRNRSVKEVRDYLVKKKFAPAEIAETIDNLIELKFLNDEKFAEEWVEIRTRIKPSGPIKLKFELRQKGIDEEIIKKVTKLDYSPIIKALALRYSHKDRQKMTGFLGRRGFTWDQIQPILDKY